MARTKQTAAMAQEVAARAAQGGKTLAASAHQAATSAAEKSARGQGKKVI